MKIFKLFFKLCIERKLKHTDFYHDQGSTGISKSNFWKQHTNAKNDPNHELTRNFVIAMGLFLKLNFEEFQEFISLNGNILTPNFSRDCIIIQAINSKEFSVVRLNIALVQAGFKPLTQKRCD